VDWVSQGLDGLLFGFCFGVVGVCCDVSQNFCLCLWLSWVLTSGVCLWFIVFGDAGFGLLVYEL